MIPYIYTDHFWHCKSKNNTQYFIKDGICEQQFWCIFPLLRRHIPCMWQLHSHRSLLHHHTVTQWSPAIRHMTTFLRVNEPKFIPECKWSVMRSILEPRATALSIIYHWQQAIVYDQRIERAIVWSWRIRDGYCVASCAVLSNRADQTIDYIINYHIFGLECVSRSDVSRWRNAMPQLDAAACGMITMPQDNHDRRRSCIWARRHLDWTK